MLEGKKVISNTLTALCCVVITLSNMYSPVLDDNNLSELPDENIHYEIANISELIPARHIPAPDVEVEPIDTDAILSKDQINIYYNSKLMMPTREVQEEADEEPEEPTAEEQGQMIADIAESMVGTPYQYAGAGEDAVDCSGLVVYCYAQMGIDLPHSSYTLCTVGTEVAFEDIRPGDIICWDNQGGSCGHVGIYIGDGMMVDARGENEGVIYGTLDLHPILTVRRIFN